MPDKQCIMVVGMHRSGTSALAGVLGICGATPGTDLLPAAEDNEKGYFENSGVFDMNERLLTYAGLPGAWDSVFIPDAEWSDRPDVTPLYHEAFAVIARQYQDSNFIVAKDPRLCFLYPFWDKAFREVGYATGAVLTYRHPLEVAASLSRRSTGFTEARGVLLWTRHVLEMERCTRHSRRSFVSYDKLLDDPYTELRKTESHLGVELPRNIAEAEREIADFLSPSLRHYRRDQRSLNGYPGLIAELSSLVERVATGEVADDTEFQRKMDFLYSEHEFWLRPTPRRGWVSEYSTPRLYVDDGSGFSEATAIQPSKLRAGSSTWAVFDIARDGVKRVRLDPIEGAWMRLIPGKVHVEYFNRKGEDLSWESARCNRTAKSRPWWLFETLDPTIEWVFGNPIRQLVVSFVQESYSCNQLADVAGSLKSKIVDLSAELVERNHQIHLVTGSIYWRAMTPIRRFLDGKPVLRRHVRKFAKLVWWTLSLRLGREINRRLAGRKNATDDAFLTRELIRGRVLPKRVSPVPQREIAAMNAALEFKPLISILMPTYNTPTAWIEDAIYSLFHQVYPNWELCIADGNSNPATKTVIQQLADNHERVKVAYLSSNLGIAGNTIKAFELATGDFVGLLDHDDFLATSALYRVASAINQFQDADFIYSDRAVFADTTRRILGLHRLPGYGPDRLRASNYASHFNVFSRSIINKVGFERVGFDGSQDYDLELRAIECARRIVNIPEVLYFCRASDGSVASSPTNKMYAYEAGKKALEEHLSRIGYPGEVEFQPSTFSYRIHYSIRKEESTCVLIPSKDNWQDLDRCVRSIRRKESNTRLRIYVIENNSSEDATFRYYEQVAKDPSVKILYYPNPGFNFAGIMNWAVRQVECHYLLLLNNDTEVISNDFATEMQMFAQRDDIGAVGAKLYYRDGTIQHAGLFIGIGDSIASHYDWGKAGDRETGEMQRLILPNNYSAVTAACMMVKRTDYLKVNGFDEEHFGVALNDVDFCLKLRQLGKVNVWTPYAELFHYEGVSRGLDTVGENRQRFQRESNYFREKWSTYFTAGDPYNNPNWTESV